MSDDIRYESKAAAARQGQVALGALIAGLTNLDIELDQEDDGRIIAEIGALPGCMVYGLSREDAVRKVQALALRVIADKIEHGEFGLNGTMAGH